MVKFYVEFQIISLRTAGFVTTVEYKPHLRAQIKHSLSFLPFAFDL